MNPFVILILIILFFGAIALLVFLLRKFVPGIKEKDGVIDEETAVHEELQRVLEPIEDEKTQIEMAKFHEEANKKDE